MERYYLQKKPAADGSCEVHTGQCFRLPQAEDCIFVGVFRDCKDALSEAQRHCDHVNGCFLCAKECYQPPAAWRDELRTQK